ncbi:MAG: hypothetical protein Q9227_004413 [Pyrenula ochraceoflavens]
MSLSMSGSYIATPDTRSSVYPDRSIRPLPKRTLRSRLSAEAAESISFPPKLPTSSLPVSLQYGDVAEFGNDAKVHVQQHDELYEHDHDHIHDHGGEHCHHDEEDDGLDSTDEYSSVLLRRSSGILPRNPNVTQYSWKDTAADGYDAFENTNNKKKRKIPTSGNPGLNHVNLSADLAGLKLNGSGNSGGGDDSSGVRQYYGSGSAAVPVGSGLSGAGRGRYGRDAIRRTSGRNPLGVSMNGSNVWHRGAGAQHTPQINQNKDDYKSGGQGIIAAAVANAKRDSFQPKGQENTSLLDSRQKSSPTNAEFTFTCNSDAAQGTTFPEQSLYSSGYAQRAHTLTPNNLPHGHKISNQGTQTSPNGATPAPPQAQAGALSSGQQIDAQGRKPRRTRSELYVKAARTRRRRQAENNRMHPLSGEDIWVCEFCEYEDIFGRPPLALIRQYEIKDRKEQKRLREKRRLLEKAKMKGRKGKKQTKGAAKNAAHNTQSNTQQQSYDDPTVEQDYDGHEEEYFDEGDEDDPISMPAPPRDPVKQASVPAHGVGEAANKGRIGSGA